MSEADESADQTGAEGGEGSAGSIGAVLRRLRVSHELSIRRLAALAGVSASLISEVERGRVEPSISVLKRLATALDVNLVYFFSGEAQQPKGRVVKADRRRRLGGSDGIDIEFELLGITDAETSLEPIYGRFAPGASTGRDPIQHEGEEWGMVLKGRLKVWVGDEVHFLDEGDAISFRSDLPHRLANPLDDQTTEYVWVNSKPTF